MELPLTVLEDGGEQRSAIVVELALRVIIVPPRRSGFKLVKILLLDKIEPGGDRVFNLQVLLVRRRAHGQPDHHDVTALDGPGQWLFSVNEPVIYFLRNQFEVFTNHIQRRAARGSGS